MANYKASMYKEELDEYLRKIHDKGHSMKTAEVPSVIYKNALVYYGSWKNALSSLDLCQEGSKQIVVKRKWTIEKIEASLIKALEIGYSKTDIAKRIPDLYATILRNYGSIEHFANTVGISLAYYGIKTKENYRIKVPTEFVSREILEKPEVNAFLKELISTDVKIDDSNMLVNHPMEYRSIKHYYGNLAEAFASTGVYIMDKSVPKNWTAEFLTAQILLGYEINKPLNTSYVISVAPSAEEFARKCFGSWKDAIISAGLPIEYVELDSQKASRDGHKFEEILGEILGDLGVNFRKYEHERWRPDFVVGNHWIDAKLSQWTVYNSETIENYEPHCEELTIVFLRGDKDFDRKLTGKTRMINVYKLLKELPQDKRQYYCRKLSNVA